MNYYAVQVRTGKEENFIKLAKNELINKGFDRKTCDSLLWIRRRLFERKGGKKKETLRPLYPGYIFFQGNELPADIHWILRRTPGFFRFLKNNKDIRPLTGKDKEILEHFLKFGEVAEKSKVIFDKDNRITVVSGPMIGMEGIIEKVDRRKGRAKIRLSLNNNSMLVDLAFDVIQSSEEKNG
ncbi:MAG: antiterminator LoaP [Spirochaetales bacterium]|nr:antiterminator LoaP [Spirochaetales bacterium]